MLKKHNYFKVFMYMYFRLILIYCIYLLFNPLLKKSQKCQRTNNKKPPRKPKKVYVILFLEGYWAELSSDSE